MTKRFIYILIVLITLSLSGCEMSSSLNEAMLYIDVNTEILSYDSLDFDANLISSPTYSIDLVLHDDVLFSNDFKLYINDMLIERTTYVINDEGLTYTFNHIDDINPDLYVEVETTFNLNGGELTKDDFTNIDPDARLIIQTLNDGSGDTFTIVNDARYSLRWFYKLFVNYNELYEAYEVVYVDQATNSVENLNLPDYDFILALDNYFPDQSRLDVIESYVTLEKQARFVIFDQNVLDYESGDMQVSFYTADQIGQSFTKTLKDEETLPIPIRDEFNFLGWFDGDVEVSTYPGYQLKDQVTHMTYEAKWETYDMENLEQHLDLMIPDETSTDLELITSYSGFNLTWSSSDANVISDEGHFIRPYQQKTITLSVTVISSDIEEVLTYDVIAIGYKSLDKPIASSYIYREYQAVDDNFFDILDVINTAFIIADEEGNLAGTNYLNQVTTHIMPKAKQYGNWVIMSIGPSSSWSTIAGNAAKLSNFASQIVIFINEYGFDGVDIDWETPTTAETKLFTNLMKEVNRQVKLNNPNHLVTAAIGGGIWQPPKYDLNYSAQYIDYINLMTYGATSGSGQYQNPLYKQSVFHNTTYKVGRTLSSTSIEESVKMYKDTYGISYDKIIVGVAFYGMKQVKSGTSWVKAGSVYYHEIYNTYLKLSTYTEYYDQGAGVPYLLKNDGTEFISYDSPRSIIEKGNYIIDEGLAGMMFWEYGTDTSGVLLQALGTALQK